MSYRYVKRGTDPVTQLLIFPDSYNGSPWYLFKASSYWTVFLKSSELGTFLKTI